MRTSFHHQPEAQHPNFQLSTSWQADYPIFGALSGLKADISRGPGCANRVQTHCSKRHSYSITSSARASYRPQFRQCSPCPFVVNRAESIRPPCDACSSPVRV
jgi:hypothetical protein